MREAKRKRLYAGEGGREKTQSRPPLLSWAYRILLFPPRPLSLSLSLFLVYVVVGSPPPSSLLFPRCGFSLLRGGRRRGVRTYKGKGERARDSIIARKCKGKDERALFRNSPRAVPSPRRKIEEEEERGGNSQNFKNFVCSRGSGGETRAGPARRPLSSSPPSSAENLKQCGQRSKRRKNTKGLPRREEEKSEESTKQEVRQVPSEKAPNQKKDPSHYRPTPPSRKELLRRTSYCE